MIRPVLLLALVAGCVDELPPLAGTTSLRVEMIEPTDVGAVDRRVFDKNLTARLKVTALDARGQVDTGFNATTQVYVQFLGSITPELGAVDPLATIPLVNGVSVETSIALERVYGPTTIWIEDGAGETATYATGTSPTLWFKDVTIAEVQRPKSETALDKLVASPLELKQVAIGGSSHGAKGRLVVTSVYTQGYTVSDVLCQDEAGTPPCTAGDYDHMLVFTFSAPISAPPGGDRRLLQVGDTLTQFGGGVQEFNGLTELSFPTTKLSAEPTNPARVPAAATVDATDADSWFLDTLRFEKAESGLVAVENGLICPLDRDWERFQQWKIALGGDGCNGNVMNVITTGVLDFDPGANAGRTVARLVGAFRPLNLGSFNVWILYPRTNSDLTLAP